jgi:hypothetical protein
MKVGSPWLPNGAALAQSFPRSIHRPPFRCRQFANRETGNSTAIGNLQHLPAAPSANAVGLDSVAACSGRRGLTPNKGQGRAVSLCRSPTGKVGKPFEAVSHPDPRRADAPSHKLRGASNPVRARQCRSPASGLAACWRRSPALQSSACARSRCQLREGIERKEPVGIPIHLIPRNPCPITR